MRVLNTGDLLEICSKLNALDISDVLITGGEIFHVKEFLPAVCSKIKEMGLPISFSTSYIYDKPFINLLFSFSPRSINLSLDPQGKEGDQGYKNIIKNTEYILELGVLNNVSIKITGVINKANVHRMDDYIKLIKKFIKQYSSITSIYITNPYDIGFIKTDIRAGEKVLGNLLSSIKVGKNYPQIKFVNFYRFNLPLQQCFGGTKYVHLEPNGNIYPCHLFANLNQKVFMMGNILNDRPEDINSNLNSFGKQAEEAVNEYKENNKTCKTCNVNKKCGAGCLAEIISIGNLIEPQLVCKKIPPPKMIKPRRIVSQLPLPLPYDLTAEDEEKIIEYIKKNIRKSSHDLAHGFDHVECVVKLARFIAKKEGANLKVVTAAAYFHDFAPRQKLLFESHTKLSAEKAVEFLKKIGFTEDELNRIYHCIDTSSYGSSEMGYIPDTIEAKVVRDADWLDAIGARGIARVVAFASAHGCETLGECSWEPRNPPKKSMSLVGPDPSPIYHFFSKLLWIKDKIATETGRAIGEVRHKRLVSFLENYRSEMNGESLDE
jgi:uncharacterized protein